MSSALLLACGDAAERSGLRAPAEGAGLTVCQLPSPPTRPVLDPVLAELAGRRLVVSGSDADLAAVVLRLVRTQRLGEVEVVFAPSEAGSTCATRWGVTGDGTALAAARDGVATPVPVVRDDAGGVLLGLGVLEPVDGVAYCDEDTVLRGVARRIEVRPESPAGLTVRVVRRGRLGGSRVRDTYGRAVQLGCVPVRPVCDGVVHPRPVQRWTWYRHTEDLLLVR